MDYSKRLSISYYKTIATLNEDHKIYLVRHLETGKIYIKKILDIYNKDIYTYLLENPIDGIPKIEELYEEDNQLTVIEHYISGSSLSELIENRCLDFDSILRYATELCDILAPLHALCPPIVHRDIKPSNIIITQYNHAVLLDFNAAKYYTKPEEKDTILLGTKGYAAPEQYGFGSSSPKTDIYSLGVLIKEMHASCDDIPSSSSTQKLNRIVSKCTQIKPTDRYESVMNLKDVINKLSPDQEEHTKEATQVKPFLPPGYRTLTPWKMFYATAGYAFLFWMCFSLEFENAPKAAIWIERIFVLIMFLSIIFANSNYMGLQKHFPLCNHKKRALHYLGILLLDATLILVVAFIMCFLVLTFT